MPARLCVFHYRRPQIGFTEMRRPRLRVQPELLTLNQGNCLKPGSDPNASHSSHKLVVPAQTGTQFPGLQTQSLAPRLRGGDGYSR
jgi:hypothetical protein